MPSVSAPRDRVVYWVEHDSLGLLLGRAENHYLVRFYDDSLGKRACELKTESDRALPTASDGTPGYVEEEAVTGSPVVFGSPRTVVSLGYQGPLTTWSVGAGGWPVIGSGSVVDVSPWDLTPPITENHRGGDTSVLVNPATQSLVWGNKCSSARSSFNPEPCSVDAWGKVNIVDLLAPAPPVTSVALDAWVSSSPVALSNDAGASGSDFLFVLGTEISTNVDAFGDGVAPNCDGSVAPLNAEYDCALTMFLWDGSELIVTDHWDAAREFEYDPVRAALPSCCEIDPAVEDGPSTLANGWVGEPVPLLGGNEIIAAKAHGELYRFEVDPVMGTLSMHHKFRFVDPSAVPVDDDTDPEYRPRYRIPPEQSPVVGRYPYDPTNYELLVMLHDTIADTSKYLILDVDGWTVGSSLVDPAPWVELQTVHRQAGWAPAAAARSISENGPVYDALTFVVAVGSDVPIATPVHPVTSAQCPLDPADGTPPRLYFLTKGTDTDPTWTTQHVDLDSGDCYEQVDGAYVPIDVISGVVVQGAMVYVATSDGLFWEYDTSDPNAVVRLQGYSGPWPRFRNNNHGMAHP